MKIIDLGELRPYAHGGEITIRAGGILFVGGA
jgi:hypothetical protein